MLIRLPLLTNANTTTPGQPFMISGLLTGAFIQRFCSATFTASAPLDVYFQRAENENGPWEATPIATDTIPQTGLAGEVVTTQISNSYVIWLRARLVTAPTAGDVTVNLYIQT